MLDWRDGRTDINFISYLDGDCEGGVGKFLNYLFFFFLFGKWAGGGSSTAIPFDDMVGMSLTRMGGEAVGQHFFSSLYSNKS